MNRQQKHGSGKVARPLTSRRGAPSRKHSEGHEGRFATAINCMDGRVQLPVINWMKQNLSADYVDMITEPGPDKILAEGSAAAQESIKARVLISVNKHGSDTILVVSHHDCAGNPVTREEHEAQLRECLTKIRSWNLPVKRVLGAWVGDTWTVEIVDEPC
ncbi:MAG: hypothetical protein QUS33_13150 [Dehalococcoidia bacterium]|nr:hypothetical protein [Dehalococcoidia bacterium]